MSVLDVIKFAKALGSLTVEIRALRSSLDTYLLLELRDRGFDSIEDFRNFTPATEDDLVGVVDNTTKAEAARQREMLANAEDSGYRGVGDETDFDDKDWLEGREEILPAGPGYGSG